MTSTATTNSPVTNSARYHGRYTGVGIGGCTTVGVQVPYYPARYSTVLYYPARYSNNRQSYASF